MVSEHLRPVPVQQWKGAPIGRSAQRSGQNLPRRAALPAGHHGRRGWVFCKTCFYPHLTVFFFTLSPNKLLFSFCWHSDQLYPSYLLCSHPFVSLSQAFPLLTSPQPYFRLSSRHLSHFCLFLFLSWILSTLILDSRDVRCWISSTAACAHPCVVWRVVEMETWSLSSVGKITSEKDRQLKFDNFNIHILLKNMCFGDVHVVVFLISEFESKCLAERILLECNDTLNKTIWVWSIFNCEVRNGYISFYCWEIAFVLHDFATWSYINSFCELWLAMFQDLMNCTVFWHLHMNEIQKVLADLYLNILHQIKISNQVTIDLFFQN